MNRKLWDAVELKEFKPCVVKFEGLGLTQVLLEDCGTVSKPVFEGVHHTVDWLESFDGRIVGLQVWK